MEAAEWATQVRRGILEFCVLALVSVRPRYGYELVTELSRWEQLAASEGTLYPLLRRLQKEGQIEAFWQPSEAGPPRKYYRLTADGERTLRLMQAEWQKLTRAVDDLQSSKEAK